MLAGKALERGIGQRIGQLLLHLPNIIEFGTKTALCISIKLPDQLFGFFLKTIL